jgi:GNAT superfamily N-acetyltransferase
MSTIRKYGKRKEAADGIATPFKTKRLTVDTVAGEEPISTAAAVQTPIVRCQGGKIVVSTSCGPVSRPALPKTKSSPSALSPMQPKSLSQTFLDFGQKGFWGVDCPTCGMHYVPGEDDTIHSRFCKLATQSMSVPLASVPPSAVVQERPRAVLDSSLPSSCAAAVIDRVVRVVPSLHKKFIKFIERVVHPELGVTNEVASLDSHSALLYVADGKIQGCVVYGGPRGPCIRYRDTGSPASTTSELVLPGDDVVVVVVRVLFVARDFRRCGVASALLDAIRTTWWPSGHVPLDAFAFAQPTTDGAAVAAKFTGRRDFHVSQ